MHRENSGCVVVGVSHMDAPGGGGAVAAPLPAAPERPFNWPPLTGRKRFPSLVDQPTLVSDVVNRPAKKLFTPRSSAELDELRTPSERRRLDTLLATTPTNLLSSAEDLVFLSGRRNKWRPTGRMGEDFAPAPGTLREDQYLMETTREPKEPHPPVFEPSQRLLRGLKRGEPAPIKRIGDGKKANTKLVDRLFSEHERREKKREAALAMRETTEAKARLTPRKITEDDLGDYLARLVTQPMVSRQKESEKLMRKFAPAPPQRKLTTEQQRSAVTRLYDQGQERIKSATARAVQKFVDDRKPKVATISTDELAASAERLSTPRRLPQA
jgi:hypothetical protein